MPAALALAAAAAVTVFSNTETVEAVEERDGALWVTTTGGVERYDLGTLERTTVLTAMDGVRVTVPPAAPAVAPRYQGARETVRVATSVGTVVGTAGEGAWLDGAAPRRLTPSGQICGSHVTALVTWQRARWVATFDAGVCHLDAASGRWITPATPFRMVNDLAVTERGLVVAASEGLFVSTDGVSFTRWAGVVDEGFNDLAVDGSTLYATTPGALWRLPLGKRGKARTTWKPGGARALQAVDVRNGVVWVVSEDAGVLRVGRRDVERFDRAAGLPTSWALDVTQTRSGDVWVATLRHGLLRRRGNTWERVAGLEDAWLLFVGPDGRGRGVWVGAQGGLHHVAADGAVTTYTRLPDANVHVVVPDGDAVWVGTERGLVHAPPASLR